MLGQESAAEQLTSSQRTRSPTAGQATNDATHIRVRLCKRTDDGGRRRRSALRFCSLTEMHATPRRGRGTLRLTAKLLRGSTGSTRRAAITGTSITTSAHTFANAGFNVTLTGTAGELAKVQVGRIVKVTKGGDAATFYRAVVSVIVSVAPRRDASSDGGVGRLRGRGELQQHLDPHVKCRIRRDKRNNRGGKSWRTLSVHNHQTTHGHGSDLSDAEEMYWGLR